MRETAEYQMSQKDRRALEDRLFNKMMIWLVAAALTEIYFVIVNRFYVHARVAELSGAMIWRTLLLVFCAVGIVLFVVLLLLGRKKRASEGSDTILPYAGGAACLVAGIGSLLMRTGSTNMARLVLAAVPGLAVLALVFYLYQKEFFPCVLVGELGILSLLVFRTSGASTPAYYGLFAVTLIVAAFCIGFLYSVGKREGTVQLGGSTVRVLSSREPKGAVMACALTALVTLAVMLCPMFLGGAMAYYGIWILAAWLFILAVYFTSKLM